MLVIGGRFIGHRTGGLGAMQRRPTCKLRSCSFSNTPARRRRRAHHIVRARARLYDVTVAAGALPKCSTNRLRFADKETPAIRGPTVSGQGLRREG
jgi:hypothetical protein